MINQGLLQEQWELGYRNSWDSPAIKYISCKHCDFFVTRFDVHSRRGCHVKYFGMRSLMVNHIHTAHPEIWAKCQIKTTKGK